MPRRWLNVFFEENSQRIADMYELTSEEKEAAFAEWAEEMFETDLVVYRNGEKAILEGRNSALSTLQRLCLKRVLERTGVRDRSRELALAQTGVK
jgi:hypothetical protein